ncbi:PrsW family intramembrane metalloprotease [Maridesulfovibrio frigidus]|uniref:PrsW family intramembrane metalloprotease n=1 Tax=Maridesulfovibrio frigidus TaxID=340956 RepID=UPI0004E170DA|nr:PrsW family intramembrane metalloprotease [Maridesulfovibrio frigidus]
MYQYFIIALSVAIGLYFIKLLRNCDIHQKEPISKMVLVTFLGGILSFAIAISLYMFLDSLGVDIDDIQNSFGALFVIGPVEEFSKLIGLFLCLAFIRKNLNEPTDGLVYMSCVALGFSLIENFFYVAESTDPFQLMGLRLALATPMHISFSLFMGLAVFSIVINKRGWPLLGISILYAIICHGIYDLVIFKGFIIVVIYLVIKMAHSWSFSLLEYTTAISPHRFSLKDFIANFNNPPEEDGIECLYCGDKNEKTTYTMEEIRVQRCHNCSFYVTTKYSLFKLFNHFGSQFRGLSSNYYATKTDNGNLYTLHDGNYVSDQKEIVYFDLEALNDVLEKLTLDAVLDMPSFIRSAIEPPKHMQLAITKITKRKKETAHPDAMPADEATSTTEETPIYEQLSEPENAPSKVVISKSSEALGFGKFAYSYPSAGFEETPESIESKAAYYDELDVRNSKNSFSKRAFFHFLLYPLEGSKMPKPLYEPTEEGPPWCWGAFMIPELWFLWHEIWGAAAIVWIAEGVILYMTMSYLGFMDSLLLGGLSMRIAGAMLGHRIYYFRNGHWLR